MTDIEAVLWILGIKVKQAKDIVQRSIRAKISAMLDSICKIADLSEFLQARRSRGVVFQTGNL
jgi:hypothetical protein